LPDFLEKDIQEYVKPRLRRRALALDRFLRLVLTMIRGSAAVWLAVFIALPAGAQELEPRTYSASPVGIDFFVVGVAWRVTVF
jgi:hypothetical protein